MILCSWQFTVRFWKIQEKKLSWISVFFSFSIFFFITLTFVKVKLLLFSFTRSIFFEPVFSTRDRWFYFSTLTKLLGNQVFLSFWKKFDFPCPLSELSYHKMSSIIHSISWAFQSLNLWIKIVTLCWNMLPWNFCNLRILSAQKTSKKNFFSAFFFLFLKPQFYEFRKILN